MSEVQAEGWASVTLGQLAKGFRGVSYRPENLLGHASELAVTLLRATNIQKGTLTFADVQFVPAWLVAPTQVLEPGDIAVCMSNGSKTLVGKSAPYRCVQQTAHTVGAFCSIFKPIEKADTEFLIHLFRSQTYQKNIDVVLAGSAINNLKNSSIESAVFKVPVDRRLRKKIATILTSIDTTIEKTEALIEKYQHIKAGLMHDLFTRGVLPNGKLRPPREQAPELYRETAIGWIPKEWEVVKLNEILNRIDAGWSPECQEIPPGAGEWGVLKVSAVTKGIFDPSESKTLPKHLPSDPTIEVAEGDIILTRANGVAELVGVTVQVRSTPTKLMLSDKLLRLVPNPIRMTKDFLYFSMCTSTIKSQIESVMSGSSGQRNISQAQIKNFDCVCPQAKEQTLISTALRKIERSVDREREITSKFLHQKLGLMQDLLSGKVEVKTTEAVAESMDG